MKTSNYKQFTIHHFEELRSTNDTAFLMAQNQEIFDFEIILANSQSSGKGRNERNWNSPNGNLYFSLVLKPNLEIAKIPQISFVAIAALRIAIEKINIQNLEIKNKWPNDLLINQKKVAGLLLESKFSQNSCNFVIVGIGLNLISNPDNTIFPSSNLKDCGIAITKEKILELFLDQFTEIYNNYLSYGFKGIRNLWLKEAYLLDKEIKAKNGSEEITGIFKDLDEEGNLLIEVSGVVRKILAADIF
ncbi:MAG: biotin--[acetyl-CoA-carboxylase] ligase [Pelagibacterales bacterium]|nr:biotin--[acetyl-CoA-carboxylase] ligase [Pelagibacterales bacterium]